MTYKKSKRTITVFLLLSLLLFVIFSAVVLSLNQEDINQNIFTSLFSNNRACFDPCWRESRPGNSNDEEIERIILLSESSSMQSIVDCTTYSNVQKTCSWLDKNDDVIVYVFIRNGSAELLRLIPLYEPYPITLEDTWEHLGQPDRYSAVRRNAIHGGYHIHFVQIYSELGIAIHIHEFEPLDIHTLAIAPDMIIRHVFLFDPKAPEIILNGRDGLGPLVGQVQAWDNFDEVPLEMWIGDIR